jgi:hypothetical protein
MLTAQGEVVIAKACAITMTTAKPSSMLSAPITRDFYSSSSAPARWRLMLKQPQSCE